MMKSTGMVRRTDPLGRIVIPMEIRRTIGIEKGDSMEIFIDGHDIILRKFAQRCVFCGKESQNYISQEGKKICMDCAKEINQIINQ